MKDSPVTTPVAAIRAFTALAAITGWSALLVQLVLSLQMTVANGDGLLWGLVIYFGYFTLLTNILVALALSAPLLAPASITGRFFVRPGVVTMTTAAILVVGVAYHFLLRNIWNPQGWALVADITLHYIMPAAFLIYWLVAVPKAKLRWSDIPKWTVYPIGYFVYVLLRGTLTGHYPYYFIDVSELGYGAAVQNAFGVLAGFLAVAAGLVAVARLTARFPRSSEENSI